MSKTNELENCKLHSFKTEMILQKVIHKDSKIPVFLAKQQSICLSLLMQGKTAKKIAIDMNLSYRTVQHYLARIRHLLGCTSTRELIIVYGNQIISNLSISSLKL